MKKTWDIVYVNNLILGHFEDNVYKNYSKEEKNELFAQLKKEVIKKIEKITNKNICKEMENKNAKRNY